MAATEADRARVARESMPIELRQLRDEYVAAGRYLRVVGGKIAHLIEAEHLVAARHLALHVVEIADRLERRGNGGRAA